VASPERLTTNVTTVEQRSLSYQQQVTKVDGQFRPIRLLEVELSRPLPAVPARDPETGLLSHAGLALARLHTQPLGLVHLSFDEAGLAPEALARQIWATLDKPIQEHLRQDGLPEAAELGAAGLPAMAAPPCTRERRLALADAPLLSVIIPTRDRPELLRTCLASLTALDYPDYEVLVVDNAPSSDETARVVAEMGRDLPRLRYLREERPGASHARNRGLEEAKGDIVAFTDDDTTVDRYWLAELVKGFRSEENVGCVTGNVLPQRLDTPARAWFGERGGFSRGFTRLVYDLDEHRSDHPLYPYNAMVFGSGNNMAFRTAVVRAIGGFDPVLDPASPAQGGEDSAAFFDVIARGYRLVYEPGALVRHLDRRDYEGLRRQMYGWGVGFTAFLVRSLLAHPRLLPGFVLRMPYTALLYLRGRIPYGKEQQQKLAPVLSPARTQELWRLEKAGYRDGLWAYWRSRWQVLRANRRYGSSAAGRGPH
jgi:glycosyltransferase involved in cell wall biosynthesis